MVKLITPPGHIQNKQSFFQANAPDAEAALTQRTAPCHRSEPLAGGDQITNCKLIYWQRNSQGGMDGLVRTIGLMLDKSQPHYMAQFRHGG